MSAGGAKKKPGLYEIFEKLTKIEGGLDSLQGDLKVCTLQIQEHHKTLYGTPQDPGPGLVMKMDDLEGQIGLVKKVAFALVPGTGAIWIAAQYIVKLFYT